MVTIFRFDHMTGENREYREKTKQERTLSKDTRTVEPKMFSVPGSDRDPVRHFHLNASKRLEQINSEDSPFY